MNPLARDLAYQLIYAGCEPEPGRFTSDLPITPDVWLEYAKTHFENPLVLLLTPHSEVGNAVLRIGMQEQLEAVHLAQPVIATNESHLRTTLTFAQMMGMLPLTQWWSQHMTACQKRTQAGLTRIAGFLTADTTAEVLSEEVLSHVADAEGVARFKDIGKRICAAMPDEEDRACRHACGRLINVAALYVGLSLLGLTDTMIGGRSLKGLVRERSRFVLRILSDCCGTGEAGHPAPLWHIALNRMAQHTIHASRRTVKADAAVRVFETGGAGVRWAIIDSGIDARHPAFVNFDTSSSVADLIRENRNPARSRVVQTLDFTRLVPLTEGTLSDPVLDQLRRQPRAAELLRDAELLAGRLAAGRMLDWSTLEPLLQVPHDEDAYVPPVDSHGTHVAGILGAGWRGQPYLDLGLPLPLELADTTDLLGVCPAIELLDLRVFDGEGRAEEFTILAALQYIRYLNQSRDKQQVHGCNLSLALRHEVRSHGCGSTPVCLECNRLVRSGVVVVAAAGNFGYDAAYADTSLGGAFRGQSLTDPGNAANVITVGSTHRSDPHLYGVSYFSSRGPTGDGRCKPDLVAPGEKILSTLPNGRLGVMDGTSMAAPHVSGVAALLLARNLELMGQPDVVKRILCSSATDLGRERFFQGSGLVDALRALQAS